MSSGSGKTPARPTLAALLSAVVPGAGQWYGGRRRAALVFGSIVGVGFVALVVMAVLGPSRLLQIFVQTRWLWVLFSVNLVLLAARLFAVGDAYRGERRRGGAGSPWLRWAALVALFAVTAVPHIVVADYSLQAIDTLETVFVDEELAPIEERKEEAIAAGVDPADFGPVLSTTTTSSVPVDSVSTSTTAATTTSSVVLWDTESGYDDMPDEPEVPGTIPGFFGTGESIFADDPDRLTVLLAGGDAGPQRWSLRTDVMIVATIDRTTNKAALIGISRDLVWIPLPAGFAQAFVDRDHALWNYRHRPPVTTTTTSTTTTTTVPDPTTTTTAAATTTTAAATTTTASGSGNTSADDGGFEPCNCFPDRLNEIYHNTHTWLNTFPDSPDPGMEALSRTLSFILGLHIDYYVLVDMGGFVDLVDALGGVDIDVEVSMYEEFSPAKQGEDWYWLNVRAGRHHLNGHQALAYVRNRSDSNDGNRMRRQRCMLRAVAAEMTPTTLLTRFHQVAEAIKGSTTTNIPLSGVPELIGVASALSFADITSFAIGAPAHSIGSDFRGLPMIDVDAARLRVATGLAGLEEGLDFTESRECPAPRPG